MAAPQALLVNVHNNELKKFFLSKITFGRNPNCDVNIPDCAISRYQCELRFNNNSWIIENVSSHQSTLLNHAPLPGVAVPLKSGDAISFANCSVEFVFYQNETDYKRYLAKKRRSSLADDQVPNKISKTDQDGTDVQLTAIGEADGLITSNLMSAEIELMKEDVKRYRKLYEKNLQVVEKLKSANAFMSGELEEKLDAIYDLKKKHRTTEQENETLRKEKEILLKEKEVLLSKLSNEEEAKEKMVLEMQNVIEALKEVEEEKNRLVEEARSRMEQPEDGLKSGENKSSDAHGSISPATVLTAIDLIESETALCRLKSDLQKMTDQVTDLTVQREKHRQELLEMVDKELLCSICSEVLFNARTLNCRHTFCESCLSEWKLKKKECPVCRCRIKTEVQPLFLDSYIDRLCDFLGGDLKSGREAVRVERSKARQVDPPTPQRRGGGRGQRRGPRHSTPRRNWHEGNLGAMDPIVLLAGAVVPESVIDLTRSPNGPRRPRRY